MTDPASTPEATPGIVSGVLASLRLEACVSEYEAAARALRDRLGVPPPLPANPGAPTVEEVRAYKRWARAFEKAVHGVLIPVYATEGALREARRYLPQE